LAPNRAANQTVIFLALYSYEKSSLSRRSSVARRGSRLAANKKNIKLCKKRRKVESHLLMSFLTIDSSKLLLQRHQDHQWQ